MLATKRKPLDIRTVSSLTISDTTSAIYYISQNAFQQILENMLELELKSENMQENLVSALDF